MKCGWIIGVTIVAGMAGLWLLGMHDKPLAPSLTVNKIVVEKSKRRLSLYSGETLLKTYPISQRLLQESGNLLPQQTGHRTCERNRESSRRTYQNTRTEERLGLDRKNTPAQRLDSRLHRLDKRRGGRALSSRTDRNPDRD